MFRIVPHFTDLEPLIKPAPIRVPLAAWVELTGIPNNAMITSPEAKPSVIIPVPMVTAIAEPKNTIFNYNFFLKSINDYAITIISL